MASMASGEANLSASVAASEAMLQRLIQVNLDCTVHTRATKALAEQLERLPLAQVSGFMLAAITREAPVLSRVDERLAVYERELQALADIHSLRIAKNHAQLMALVLPLSAEQQALAHAQLHQMAVERQQAINADHPLVQAFWEMFDYLEGGRGDAPRLNHARDPRLIAVNLSHFVTAAAEHRQPIPDLTALSKPAKCGSLSRLKQ